MKYIPYYVLTVLWVLAACHKDGEGIKPVSYFKVDLNKQSWHGEVHAGIKAGNPDTLNLQVACFRQGILNEFLAFGGIPLAPGKHRLQQASLSATLVLPQTSSFEVMDGDIGCASYDLSVPDSAQNFIEITAYEEGKKEIRGNFQATYQQTTSTPSHCPNTKPSVLSFKKGRFLIKFE
jgi:hypothetical protein